MCQLRASYRNNASQPFVGQHRSSTGTFLASTGKADVYVSPKSRTFIHNMSPLATYASCCRQRWHVAFKGAEDSQEKFWRERGDFHSGGRKAPLRRLWPRS